MAKLHMAMVSVCSLNEIMTDTVKRPAIEKKIGVQFFFFFFFFLLNFFYFLFSAK